MPRTGGTKPNVYIEKNQGDDELPYEETIEAVRTRRTERVARDIHEADREYHKGNYLEHIIPFELGFR
jgi:hypothetical protein